MASADRAPRDEGRHFPDVSREAIASWLQSARVSAGKTQMEAATHLGRDKQTISNWETARHPIGAEELLRLALFYEADVNELLATKLT